ncbi:hypothetical protein ADK54_34550 [Streptomyces sp. WM6378]|nr:hypothetical protein ADK54_34550 [Streptomyces sp. WM6378]
MAPPPALRGIHRADGPSRKANRTAEPLPSPSSTPPDVPEPGAPGTPPRRAPRPPGSRRGRPQPHRPSPERARRNLRVPWTGGPARRRCALCRSGRTLRSHATPRSTAEPRVRSAKSVPSSCRTQGRHAPQTDVG